MKPCHRLLCTAALVALPGFALAQAPAAIVQIADVTREATAATTQLPGTVISTRDSQLRAEIEGRVLWIADVGQRVEAGEPVAQIDDHLLQLQLRADEAQISRLRTDIDVRSRQRERLAKLARENNMAQVELDQIEADIDMLEQDLAIARVERERTLYDLERSKVPAPFSGVVVERGLSEGDTAHLAPSWCAW